MVHAILGIRPPEKVGPGSESEDRMDLEANLTTPG